MKRKIWMSLLAIVLALGVLCILGSVLLPYEKASSAGQMSELSPPADFKEENFSVDPNDWRLILANKSHPLPEDFLVDTAEVCDGVWVDSRITDAVLSMMAAAKEEGINLAPTSGYRSVERQKTLYQQTYQTHINEGMTDAEAKQATEAYQAPPGTSEHATGLALDSVDDAWFGEHDDLTEDFDQTEAFAWLSCHAADYGFVLRYPRGKESVTGYDYEPWHYRYVGEENAQRMKREDLTLEEFLERYAS